jgi:hypothetical protein
MAEAYDNACRSMCDWAQPDIIKEIIAKHAGLGWRRGWGGAGQGKSHLLPRAVSPTSVPAIPLTACNPNRGISISPSFRPGWG